MVNSAPISTVILGNSHETIDFIVDGLEKWYELRKTDLQKYNTIELYLDNGPSVNGHRTQFINRMMEFACITGLNINLLFILLITGNVGQTHEITFIWFKKKILNRKPSKNENLTTLYFR